MEGFYGFRTSQAGREWTTGWHAFRKIKPPENTLELLDTHTRAKFPFLCIFLSYQP